MTLQDQALAARRRDTAIDRFVTEPGGGGAQPSAASPGRRDFAVGGGTYTWSADQEKRDLEQAAKIDTKRSFAELLGSDIPAREAVAKRLWAEAGDRKAAEAELSSIDRFVNDNRETLRTLSMYQGTNATAQQVSAQASKLLTGGHRVEFAGMERDPEIKAKVADKTARLMGLGPAGGEVLAGVALGDADAVAAWGVTGASEVPRPGAVGKGKTPESARAAAHGIDNPGEAESWFGFNKEAPTFVGVGAGAAAVLGPQGRVDVNRALFSAFGGSVGKKFAGYVAQAGSEARESGDAGQAAAMKAVAEGFNSLKGALAPRDAMEGQTADAVVDSLYRLGTGVDFAKRAPSFVDMAPSVSDMLARFKASGTVLSDSRAGQLAQTEFYRRYRPGSAVPFELRGIADVLSKRSMYQNNIVSRESVASQEVSGEDKSGASPKPGATGHEMFAQMVREHLDAAAGEAIDTGKPIEQAAMSRISALTSQLKSLGVSDSLGAEAAAAMILSAALSGKEVNMAALPELLRQSDVVREHEVRGNAKDAATSAAPTPAASGVEATLYNWAAARVAPGGIPTVDPSGKPMTPDNLALTVKGVARKDPSVSLYEAVTAASVTEGLLPTYGDEGVVFTKVAQSLEAPLDAAFGPKSRAVDLLTNKVSGLDIMSKETKAQAVALAVEDFTNSAALAASGIAPAELRRLISSHIDALASELRAETPQGYGTGLSMSAQLGPRAETKVSDAVRRSTWGTAGQESGRPGTYARAFLGDIPAGVPAEVFINKAKEKVARLAGKISAGAVSMPLAQSTSKPPVSTPSLDLRYLNSVDLGDTGVARGLKAIETFDKRLRQPVDDKIAARYIFHTLDQDTRNLPTSERIMARLGATQVYADTGSPDAVQTAVSRTLAKREPELQAAADARAVKLAQDKRATDLFATEEE